MTYQEVAKQYDKSDYLSQKLINNYKNRGAALRGVKYTTTDELIRRAQRTNNSSAGTSAPSRMARERSGAYYNTSAGGGAGTTSTASSSYRRENRSAYSNQAQNRASRSNASAGAEYERLREETRRAEYELAKARERRARELARIKAYEKNIKKKEAQVRKNEKRVKKKLRKKETEELLKREIRVEKKKLSLSFVVILLVVSCMIMGVIFSFAQVYGSSRNLSEAKDSLRALQKTSEELKLELEKKNDIRTIESQATEKIGMVKENNVEKKYVSFSAGDYIELEDESAEGEERGPIGTMLSSISSALGDFMDYFN